MKRLFGLAVVLGLVLSVSVSALAEDKKTATIKQIMVQAHGAKGKPGLLPKLKGEVNKGQWEAVVKDSANLVILAADLTKTTPDKGEKESWDKLTSSYLTGAKELATAAKEKDKEAGTKAVGTLFQSCKACHQVHK